MKRIYLLCLVGIALLVSACATPVQPAPAVQPTAASAPAQGAATTAPTTGGTTAQPVEIEFWHSLSGDFGKVLEQLVTEYNQSQSAVKVTSVYKGNYQDTQKALLASLAAGDQPTVSQLEISFASTLAAKNSLKPIEEFAKDPQVGIPAAELAAMYPGFRDAASLNGVLYTMPFNTSVPVLYYNADMLEAANVKPPETWQDLAAACEALTSGSKFGLTINPGNVWIYEAMVWQNGGQLFNEDYSQVQFNQPAAVEALKYWSDLAANGCGKLQKWEDGRTDFFNGNVAFYEDSSGSLGGVLQNSKFKVGVTHIPWGKEKVETIGGATLGIFNAASPEKQQAGWDFIKFLTTPAAISRLSESTGYMPMTEAALQVEPLKSFAASNTNFANAMASLPYTRPRPSIADYAQIQSLLQTAIETAVLGKATPQQALDEAANQTAPLLAKP